MLLLVQDNVGEHGKQQRYDEQIKQRYLTRWKHFRALKWVEVIILHKFAPLLYFDCVSRESCSLWTAKIIFTIAIAEYTHSNLMTTGALCFPAFFYGHRHNYFSLLWSRPLLGVVRDKEKRAYFPWSQLTNEEKNSIKTLINAPGEWRKFLWKLKFNFREISLYRQLSGVLLKLPASTLQRENSLLVECFSLERAYNFNQQHLNEKMIGRGM